jgi:hypothetical protein
VHRLPLALATWLLIGVVLILVVVLLVVKVTRGSTAPPTPAVSLAPADVVHEATAVPASRFDAAGAAASGSSRPLVIHGPPLQRRGKVQVVEVSAQFCPYCAAEQWALVVALSRFGQFHQLRATSSSPDEVFPRLVTFSLDGATYRSTTVSLSAVEEYGPRPSPTAPAGYPRLHTLSALQQQLLDRYDRPPTVLSSGSLPFLDVANRLVLAGAAIGYSPAVLQGLSLSAIATALHQPGSPVGQAVLGAANDISAAICAADSGRPGPVCRSAGVQAAALRLKLG